MIPMSAAGINSREIARQLGTAKARVGKWRRRFLERDVAGLHDELRRGRPCPTGDEQVAQLIRKTLESQPKDGMQGSVRRWLAARSAASKDWRRKTMPLCEAPMRPQDPFYGRQPRIPPSPSYSDFVKAFPGRHTTGFPDVRTFR